MKRYLCAICRYTMPMTVRVAKVLTVYLHCMQRVPGAPYRTACPVFMREPGADDEWPRVHGREPTRYAIIAAS